eukprot:432646-Alexandrium_andersonii.AAC.1
MAAGIAIPDDDETELGMGVGEENAEATVHAQLAASGRARPGARLIASTRRQAAAPRQGALRTKRRRAGKGGRANAGAVAGPSGGALAGRPPDRLDAAGLDDGAGA